MPMTDDAVARFIYARHGARASRPTALGAGAWSRAYAFTLDGQPVVARFGAYASDFAKDRIMGGFSCRDLPIPRVLELGEAPEGHFVISERASGVMLDDLDESGMRAVLPSLLRALDAVRRIDVSGCQGFGGWGPDGHAGHPSWREALLGVAGDRLPGWRAALENSATGAGPYDAGFARLSELVADIPDVKQVIHQDLLARNVLVQGAMLSAVLDWGNSMYGDALYDAAWLIYWWPWYPAWARIDIQAELHRHWAASGPLPDDLAHRLHCYQLRIGLDHMVYNAFTGRTAALDRNTRQTLALMAQ